MNWDLIVGLVIGLSGSIIGLIGTIITNKQNKDVEIQKMIIANSIKEYELRNEMAFRLSEKEGKGMTLYPYDTFLISYVEIGKYITRKKPKDEDLKELLEKLSKISDEYYKHSQQRGQS